MSTHLFPFADYWWFYAAFTVLVIGLLTLDLAVFNRKPHAIGFREASVSTLIWALLALLFAGALYWYTGSLFGAAAARHTTLAFLTGYIVEWSLSLDNMFVFVLVFGYFGIPPRYQHRILFYGILGALVFRAIFIGIGAVLLRYSWMVVIFGAFLLITGVRMLFTPERPVNLEQSPIMRMLRRWVPILPGYEGPRFIARVNRKRYATSLLVTLAFIEMTDILFAIDSVPAIFAITSEPLVVFTSNVFAVLGLRSLYFLLAGAVGRFHLLRYGLAVVLIFVGLKMAWLNQLWEGHFPMGVSLGVIGSVLALSIGLSLAFPKREEREPAPTR